MQTMAYHYLHASTSREPFRLTAKQSGGFVKVRASPQVRQTGQPGRNRAGGAGHMPALDAGDADPAQRGLPRSVSGAKVVFSKRAGGHLI